MTVDTSPRRGPVATNSYPYRDQVVLVTGGGSGIGRAVVRGFLEQGARVATVGRTAGSLQEATTGYSDTSLTLVADLAVPGAAARVVEDVVTTWGRLDVVVASAGTSEASDLQSFTLEQWHRLRQVNLDSVLELVQSAVPHLKVSRGNVLAISSLAGIRGDWGMFAYNATKAAVNVLTQCLALDLGADGVRVNALAPGFTASRLTAERLDDPEYEARLLDRIALGRVAEPEDIARVALFLCSPDAGYLTGAVVPVDGGVSASSGTPRP